MDIIHLLQTSQMWLFVTVGLFSLLVGSFLNVVIYRLPIILEREWQKECAELHGQEATLDSKFSLVLPRSQCPSCGHQITAIENVPILSYLVLGGKCKGCRTPISMQYPLIELATALISIGVAWHFGFSIQLLAMLFFTWSLVALFMIDAKTMLLPDKITLPLMWLGILANFYGLFTSLENSVMGAMAGYMVLWLVFQLFRLVTGKDGMGFGDFKLLAALGAWGGWQILPFVVFFASALGAVFGIAWMLIQRKKDSQPLPFGPWLAVAGLIAMVWHQEVLTYTQQILFPY